MSGSCHSISCAFDGNTRHCQLLLQHPRLVRVMHLVIQLIYQAEVVSTWLACQTQSHLELWGWGGVRARGLVDRSAGPSGRTAESRTDMVWSSKIIDDASRVSDALEGEKAMKCEISQGIEQIQGLDLTYHMPNKWENPCYQWN